METKNKATLGVSLMLIVAMMIFPPERGGGYGLIWVISPGIDVSRLLVQIAVVGCLAVVMSFVTIRVAKVAGIVVVGLAVLAATVAGYAYFTEEYPRRLVSAQISFDPERCSAEYPFVVTVTNRNARSVAKVEFLVEAYVQGRNTEMLGLGRGQSYMWDWTIAPKSQESRCWAWPESSRLKITSGALNDPEFLQLEPERKLQVLGNIVYADLFGEGPGVTAPENFLESGLSYRASILNVSL